MSLEADLRTIFPPDRILNDPVSLLAYECDGYPIERRKPAIVVFPCSTNQVRDCVRYCAATETPFQARGAGTSLSGGATPGIDGLVLVELARMKRILDFDPTDRVAVVEPGLVNLELTRAVEPAGLHYAPDPSSQIVSTIGGNVALNAGGPHCFKYGMTSDHVLGVELVCADGEVLVLREGDGPDLVGLVTGSEGTFGVVTKAWLRLSPAPQVVRTWLASYASMGRACDAVSSIVRSGLTPAALEILDRLTIEAVEASVYAAGYPTDAAAVLLCELDGCAARVAADATDVEALLREAEPLTIESTTDAEQRARLWKGRKGAFGAMGRLKPDLFVLDGVVPRSKLTEVLAEVAEIGERHGIRLANVFHAGDGNLHPNLSFDSRDADETRRAMAAGHEILELCVRVGGSITGEHGVGLEKLDAMALMFEARDLERFAELRRCFDAQGICNPGKLLPTGGSCGEGSSARAPGALGGA